MGDTFCGVTLGNVPGVIASRRRGNLITPFSSPPRFFPFTSFRVRMTGVGRDRHVAHAPRDDRKKKNRDSRHCSERQRGISLLEITTVSVTNVLDEHRVLHPRMPYDILLSK
ncbi:MAG: hypothetical protein MUO97_00415 [Dehalococcoidia bacterium]|nr:hypothetical protein [Dehalococcoidia bacterium]